MKLLAWREEKFGGVVSIDMESQECLRVGWVGILDTRVLGQGRITGDSKVLEWELPRGKACRKLHGVWNESFLGTLEENVEEGILSSMIVSVQHMITDTRVLIRGRFAWDSKGVGVEASLKLLRVLEKSLMLVICKLFAQWNYEDLPNQKTYWDKREDVLVENLLKNLFMALSFFFICVCIYILITY